MRTRFAAEYRPDERLLVHAAIPPATPDEQRRLERRIALGILRMRPEMVAEAEVVAPHPPPVLDHVDENVARERVTLPEHVLRQAVIADLKAKADARGTTWVRYNLSEVLPEPTPMTWAVVQPAG